MYPIFHFICSGYSSLVSWYYKPITSPIGITPERIKQALTKGNVLMSWGDRVVEIKENRGKIFQIAYSRMSQQSSCLSSFSADSYRLSPKYRDAILLSLENNQATEELKNGGWEAFSEALVFAQAFDCEEFTDVLYTYFATDFLFQNQFSVEEIKTCLDFFNEFDLRPFVRLLLSDALLYQKIEDDSLKEEFQKQFFYQKQFSYSIQDIRIRFERDNEQKKAVILFAILGNENFTKIQETHCSSPHHFYKLLDIDPLNFKRYLTAGGDIDWLLDLHDETAYMMLNNSQALQEFLQCKGKLIELHQQDHRVAGAILRQIEKLKLFQKNGGTLDLLCQFGPGQILHLLLYATNLPTYLTNGGSFKDLLSIPKNSSALEYILKYAPCLNSFILAGGKLQELYSLPKENNTVEGAKVGVLLEHAYHLPTWIECGGTIQDFYPAEVDSGIVRTILSNPIKLKEFVQKEGKVHELLTMTYQTLMQTNFF